MSDVGKAFPGQPSIAHDSDIEGLKRLATAMKKKRCQSTRTNTSWWCTSIA